jgi:hypothetical protein
MNEKRKSIVLFPLLRPIFGEVNMKFFSLIILCFASSVLTAQSLAVLNLTCENQEDPSGIDNSFPGLSWQIISNRRNVLQTAYRILVSDNIENINKNKGDVWDSKKVNESSCIHIRYAGRILDPDKTYYCCLYETC